MRPLLGTPDLSGASAPALANNPAMTLRPASMPDQKAPPWNGCPRRKRQGTERPSIFLPIRQMRELPTS